MRTTNKLSACFVLVMVGMLGTACGTAAAPAAAPAAEAVVATTAPAAPAATDAPAPTAAPVATEKALITVKIAIGDPGGEANSLDPINQPSGENSIMVNQVYNRLLDKDSDFQVSPELAESYTKNATATEWTFVLRHGVKFHDGHELTCKDVVWTYKRLLDPASKSEALGTLSFLDSAGISCGADNYSVVFKTPKPAPDLPAMMTIKNTFIVPDGATEADLKLKGNGTGPFIAENFQPKQTPHVFVKNQNYWEKGLPKADRLEFYTITEATSAAAALQSGQVDLLQQIDFPLIETVKADAKIKLLESGASTSLFLAMWTDTPPYDDIRVRQAFKKVIDRQQWVDVAWLGYGVIGDDNPIAPSSPSAWRPEKDVPPRDVAGAIKLLAEAGYSAAKPLKVDLYASDNLPGMVTMAQLFKENAKEAGVEVNVIIGPSAEYWDNVWLKQPFVMSAHSARPPGEAIGLSFPVTSKYPETHWNRPEFDKMLVDANAIVDDAQRADAHRKLLQIIAEEGGDIFEGKYFTVAGIRANCDGYTPHIQIARFDARNLTCSAP